MAELIVYMPDHVPGDKDPADVHGEIVRRLVRCKDCRHSVVAGDTATCCVYVPALKHSKDFFCAYGERNE